MKEKKIGNFTFSYERVMGVILVIALTAISTCLAKAAMNYFWLPAKN